MFPWSDISLGYNCANRVRLNIQEAICWSRNGELGNGTRGMMGTQGIRVGTRGIRVGKQGIRVGMWGIKVGMQGMAWEWWECRECGEWGGNAGNQGENAGNHGDSSWESSCLLLRLKSRSVRGAFHPPGVMGSWPTISHTFLPCLPSGWVLLQGNEDLGSVKDFIFLYLCLVWIRRIRTQEEFKILLCNPSGGNLLLRQRIPSNIIDGAPLWKQPTALTCILFLQKSPTTDLLPDSKWESDWRRCECGVWVHCKCMELVAEGLCTKKWLRFDQTIRNLTSGDLEIPLVVIRLGVTGLKKTRVVYLLDLFEGRIPVTNPSQQSLSLTPLLPIQAPSLSLIAALPSLHSLPSLI